MIAHSVSVMSPYLPHSAAPVFLFYKGVGESEQEYIAHGITAHLLFLLSPFARFPLLALPLLALAALMLPMPLMPSVLLLF